MSDYHEGASYRLRDGMAYAELKGTGKEPHASRLRAGETLTPPEQVWRANQDVLVLDTPQPEATDGAVEAARELGVDLTTVQGTGSGGRITKPDVERAAENR